MEPKQYQLKEKSKTSTKECFHSKIMSLKEWNNFGIYQLQLEVVNYRSKLFIFGNTNYSKTNPILMKVGIDLYGVYFEMNGQRLDSFGLRSLKTIYNTRNLVVGNLQFGHMLKTVNLGYTIGTYDELGQALNYYTELYLSTLDSI